MNKKQNKNSSHSKTLRLHKADHDPRAGALVALHRVVVSGADSQAALDTVLQTGNFTPSDKRLCTELTYGTLRQFIRLEWCLKLFLKEYEKLPLEMRFGLLITAYSMMFLRIPHRASVDWVVTHVKNRFGMRMGNVANGALRALQRWLDPLCEKQFCEELSHSPEEALAYWYSVPPWVVRLWLDSYGREKAEQLLQMSSAAPLAGLRINRQTPGIENIRKTLLEEYSQTLLVGEDGNMTIVPQEFPEDSEASQQRSNRGSPTQRAGKAYSFDDYMLGFPDGLPFCAAELVRQGEASRQSPASYLVLQAVVQDDCLQPLWDCCCGRGGKAMIMLERGIPVILASDSSKKRIEHLPEEYKRLRLTAPALPACMNATAENVLRELHKGSDQSAEQPGIEAERLLFSDNDELLALPQRFGTILIDAPCSGLGTLSRRPEIRLRRTQKDVVDLVSVQRKLLQTAAVGLAPKGMIIYITCTANPEENEQQIRWFLSQHPDFRKEREYATPLGLPLGEYFYGACLQRG